MDAKQLTITIKKVVPYTKALLVLLLIISNFTSLVKQLPDENHKDDAELILQWEKRFEPIKKDLPPDNQVIGYVTDWDIPGATYYEANTKTEYILTQFTMAPIVVSRNTNFEWVLVNTDVDNFNIWIESQSGEYEVITYGYNLYLVRRIK